MPSNVTKYLNYHISVKAALKKDKPILRKLKYSADPYCMQR